MKPTRQRSTPVKAAIFIGVLMLVAVVVTLVQQLLFGKTSVAVTSAVITVSVFGMWWHLWGGRQ